MGRTTLRGPAGQLFDAALEKAGIDRSTVDVTNAVKHFKFVQKGKRRIHNKPDGSEIEACRWWIEHERELIRPPVTVALEQPRLAGWSASRDNLEGPRRTIRAPRWRRMLGDRPSELDPPRRPMRTARNEGKRLFLRDLKRIKARAEELAR